MLVTLHDATLVSLLVVQDADITVDEAQDECDSRSDDNSNEAMLISRSVSFFEQ
jgi:hypothetical protein